MRLEYSRFSGSHGADLPCLICSPETLPCMVLQITHGMTGHISRFIEVAKELTLYGIVVAGFDLRGHGENPSVYDTATFGTSGWDDSVRDMHYFRMMLEERFPGLPLYMMGFSLGSFLLREYLGIYRNPNGVILIGTGTQSPLLLSILMKILEREIGKVGFNRSSPLVKKLSFETYNRKFKSPETDADWLCSDRKQLQAYLSDPLCRGAISAGLLYQLLESMKRCSTKASYRNWDKAMPILMISGKDDPVGNMGTGVTQVMRKMKQAGLKNVQLILYPHARHDVLHEESTRTASHATDLIYRWLFKTNERS